MLDNIKLKRYVSWLLKLSVKVKIIRLVKVLFIMIKLCFKVRFLIFFLNCLVIFWILDIVVIIVFKKNGNICDNVEKYIVEKLLMKKVLINMVRKLILKIFMEIRNKVFFNCFWFFDFFDKSYIVKFYKI